MLKSKPVVFIASVFLVAAIGLVHSFIDPQLTFSVLYALPVILVTWFAGKQPGVFFSILSGAVCLLADKKSGAAHSTILYLNAAIHTFLFLAIAHLLSYAKVLTRQLEEKVAERTATLESDIVRRKKTEQALSESEKKYKELVENSMVGVFKTNVWGEMLYANRALSGIFEYDSPDELMSTSVLLLYKNLTDREHIIERLKEHGTIENYELEILTKSEKSKSVLVSATLNNDSISGMMRDITDVKRLEQRLIEAQKMESLGTLAGGIAHDFNNILGIILGHASMVDRMQRYPEKVAHGIEAIISASQRGAGLVRQLLTFARRANVLLEPVHVNTVVKEVTKLLEETFQKTIVLTTDLGKNIPLITADLNQLHQVLINLCVNARDSMPNGGTIVIRTGVVAGETLQERFPEATPCRHVIVEVIDTGSGIEEETRLRIFEPFFTTKERGKGTGLGLAVVFGIIDSHGGFIDVKSEPGRGTTFTLYLPARAHIPAAQAARPEPSEYIRPGNETILIVEDEEMLRELAESVLTGKGYTVLHAADGEEAVALYQSQKEKIDIVFSDMGLPKFSGYQVLKKIQEINPDVKFILTSGYIDPEQKNEILGAGAKEIIQKPYMPNDLLKKVREVLDER